MSRGEGRALTGPGEPRDVPIHRREPLAERARDGLVWWRLGPYSSESELLSGDEILGEMGQATRIGFDAWGECLGEAWDLRMDRGWLGVEATASDPETGAVGIHFRHLWPARGTVRIPGEPAMKWSRSWSGLDWNRLGPPQGIGLFRRVEE